MTVYIALLRGINVGKSVQVNMKKLKAVFEGLGFTDVSTYINSGNVIFSSKTKPSAASVSKAINKEFKWDIPILILAQKDMKKIADAIPKNWLNDEKQRTDVAYLFKEIDSKKTLKELPFNTDFMDVRYTKGAIFWNLKRENLNKSRLVKVVGHRLYAYMTIRNVNTARYLGGYADK